MPTHCVFIFNRLGFTVSKKWENQYQVLEFESTYSVSFKAGENTDFFAKISVFFRIKV